MYVQGRLLVSEDKLWKPKFQKKDPHQTLHNRCMQIILIGDEFKPDMQKSRLIPTQLTTSLREGKLLYGDKTVCKVLKPFLQHCGRFDEELNVNGPPNSKLSSKEKEVWSEGLWRGESFGKGDCVEVRQKTKTYVGKVETIWRPKSDDDVGGYRVGVRVCQRYAGDDGTVISVEPTQMKLGQETAYKKDKKRTKEQEITKLSVVWHHPGPDGARVDPVVPNMFCADEPLLLWLSTDGNKSKRSHVRFQCAVEAVETGLSTHPCRYPTAESYE